MNQAERAAARWREAMPRPLVTVTIDEVALARFMDLADDVEYGHFTAMLEALVLVRKSSITGHHGPPQPVSPPPPPLTFNEVLNAATDPQRLAEFVRGGPRHQRRRR